MPCSAAAMVFAVGALTTRTPYSVAAARSTLSIPTPARPTTLRRPLAAWKTSRVTCVESKNQLVLRVSTATEHKTQRGQRSSAGCQARGGAGTSR